MSKVPQNIKGYRLYKGWSQQDLAKRVGRSVNVISNWEVGRNAPDPDSIELICKALEVTPNELFGWSKNVEYVDYLIQKENLNQEMAEINKQKANLNDRLNMIQRELKKIEKHST